MAKNAATHKMMQEVDNALNETKTSLSNLYDAMVDDINMVAGAQFYDKEVQKYKDEGKPLIKINTLLKTIMTITGMERTSRSQISYAPIEGADTAAANTWTKAAKWAMMGCNGEETLSQVFMEGGVMGLNWASIDLDYSKDPVNGDLVIEQSNTFEVGFDPYSNRVDYSDAMYVYKRKIVPKGRVKARYPEKASEIEKLGPPPDAGLTVQKDENVHRDDMVELIEYWYKVFEEKIILYTEYGQIESSLDEDEFDEYVMNGGKYKKTVAQRIKLFLVANRELVLYDGESPHRVHSNFPIIPYFCIYLANQKRWDLRVLSITREIKSPQREKNFRRSALQYQTGTSTRSGWMAEVGSIDDESMFQNVGGSAQVIWYNYGKKPERIVPLPIDTALVQMEQMSDNDQIMAGPNADLIGMSVDKGATATTSKMRYKQGVAYLQSMFDNYSLMKRAIGRYMLELFTENWTVEKLRRIVGEESAQYVPDEFMQMSKMARFDVHTYETISSPTNRMTMREDLKEMNQYGIHVPGEMFVELWDIAPEEKERYTTLLKQEQQMRLQEAGRMQGGQQGGV